MAVATGVEMVESTLWIAGVRVEAIQKGMAGKSWEGPLSLRLLI